MEGVAVIWLLFSLPIPCSSFFVIFCHVVSSAVSDCKEHVQFASCIVSVKVSTFISLP